jgi:hypothetical protein
MAMLNNQRVETPHGRAPQSSAEQPSNKGPQHLAEQVNLRHQGIRPSVSQGLGANLGISTDQSTT